MIRINGYAIDVALNEEHQLNSDTTDHAVEKGSPSTDHVRILPDEIVFDCVVSDTPIGRVAQVRANQQAVAASLTGLTAAGIIASATDNNAIISYSQNAYAFLLALRAAGEPVIVESSLGTHESMLIKTLAITRSSASGKALRFKLGVKQLNIATNAHTFVEVAIPRAAKKQNVAVKESKTPPETPASDADSKRSSVLFNLIH